jgi:hypothetical protein
MGVRRLPMNRRTLARIAVLTVVVAAVTLSCSFDYMLNFDISDIAVFVNNVQFTYTLTNSGARSMDNATIHIKATADLATGGSTSHDEWTTGVELSPYDTFSQTLTYYFSGNITGPVVIEVIGAAWDEHASSD